MRSRGAVVMLAFGAAGVPCALGSAGVGMTLAACASDVEKAVTPDGAADPASLAHDGGLPEAAGGVDVGDVCGDRHGLEADSPWPMRGGCSKRAGVSSSSGPQMAGVKWSVPLSAGDTSPAISANRLVWVGTAEGDVVAVSADGVVQGALRTGGPVRSSPARSASGLTVIGSSDGVLYGVERAPPAPDGGADAGDAGADAGDADAGDAGEAGFPGARAIFSRGLGVGVSSPVLGGDGTIYVGTANGTLVAVSADGQTTKWAAITNDTLGSSPAIAADGTLYVGSSDRKLYAFGSDGAPKWSFEAGGAVGSPVVGGDETVYVGASDGILYALTASGKLRWTYATRGPITGTPAVRGGVLYVGSDDRKLHAVSTTTGERAWTYDTLGAVATPVIDSDGVVYVGSADGNLYAITPTGLLSFAVKAKGRIHSAPAIGDDTTLYVTTETALVAIGAAGD